MKILVAEDERITRVTLVRQLEALGHTVTACEDGQAAWEAFTAAVNPKDPSSCFDAVLTDWEMPRLSGLELIQQIRKADLPSYVYVILLTSRSNKEDVVSGIESGADDYISKPFDREELRVRILAGERVVRLERTLKQRNDALQAADERIRHDLRAAARVQRAMLPRGVVETPRVRTAWRYVPTDELAGDAIGLDLIDDRFLISYVLDVSGHGVPAALLSVTAMHGLSPSSAGMGALKAGLTEEAIGYGQLTATLIAEMNRRFSATDNDGRFLTMVLCVLDTHTGRLCFTRAAHPVPILLRAGKSVEVDETGGMPLAVFEEAEYEEVHLQLQPGDRLILHSDGIFEQLGPKQDVQYGIPRFEELLKRHAAATGDEVLDTVVEDLTRWAGTKSFGDDVSIVCVDWLG